MRGGEDLYLGLWVLTPVHSCVDTLRSLNLYSFGLNSVFKKKKFKQSFETRVEFFLAGMNA